MIWDAVVVGGGPAGAASACFLARRGLAVSLVDRARFPRAKPCGEFLSPAATPILDDLGVRERVEGAGALRLDRVRIVVEGVPAVELAIPEGWGAPAWGYSLSRLALDPILLEAARAAGTRVFEGIRVEDVVRDSRGRVAGVMGRTWEGEPWSARARLVVGAGGRGCPVARALGLQRRARTPRYDLLAHWRADGSLPPVCELHVGRDAYVAAAPVEDGRANVNCVVSRAALRRVRDPEALYNVMLAQHPGLADWTAGRREEPVAASDVTPLATGRATADGALLVGDAALFIDPFTGQGLYLALRSAALAASVAQRALAGSHVDRSSLAAYDEARAAEFSDKRRVSRALQGILYRPHLVRGVARALRRDRDLAATLAAVTGDLVPARRAWSFAFGARLLAAAH
jgi:flavin-dependent dehydrogenase